MNFDYVDTAINDFIEWADYDNEIAEYKFVDGIWILAWYHGDNKQIYIVTFKTKLEFAQWCFEELDERGYYDESAESDPEGIENRIRNQFYQALFKINI